MESDPREPLLPGTGKNSPADESSGPASASASASASGADISETRRTPARRSPPPPPPSLLGLGIAKDRAVSSSSPSLPSQRDQDFANNQPASLSFSSLPDLGSVSASDLEALGRQSPPATPSSHGDTSNRQDPAGPGTSTSPSSRPWWDLLGRLRRRAPRHLPVSAPRNSTRFDRLRSNIQELRRKGARLDSVGVERVIGIFGFSLFGSISLLPYTMDRIEEFATVNKSIVAFSFGIVWVLVSVGVLCGLQGKSDFEQAFCRFTGRLGVVGLAILVALHVWWTLPSDNTYCTAGFCALVVFALGLHLLSWGWTFMLGEDRIEEKASHQRHKIRI